MLQIAVLFAVQKLAQFFGSRVNERRIFLQVFVRSKICPDPLKRVWGFLQSRNSVIFLFSLLRDLLKTKPFSTSIKKMVTLFSGDIFNTIIWNIKKCSTNRRFNISASEAGGNEEDIFSLNKTSCELTPMSHKFSVTTKFSCRCGIWQRRRWRWRNGRSNLLSWGVTGLHRNWRTDHLLSWGQSLLFLFYHWVYKRVDKPLRKTHSLSIRLCSHYSYS